MAAFNVTT